jgi:hypothetical protein
VCLSIEISFRSMRRKSRSVASVLAYKPLGHDYLKNTRFYFKWLASCVFRQFLHAFMPRFLLKHIRRSRARCSREHTRGQRRIPRLAGGFLREHEITDTGITETFRNTSIVCANADSTDSYLFPRDGNPTTMTIEAVRNVTSRNSM